MRRGCWQGVARSPVDMDWRPVDVEASTVEVNGNGHHDGPDIGPTAELVPVNGHNRNGHREEAGEPQRSLFSRSQSRPGRRAAARYGVTVRVGAEFDPGPQGYGSTVAGGSDGLPQTRLMFAVFSRFLDSHLNRARVDHQNGRSISSTARGGETRGVGTLAYRFTLGSGLDCRSPRPLQATGPGLLRRGHSTHHAKPTHKTA